MIIFNYLLGGLYLVYFGILICVFHPIQWIAFNLLGRKSHQTTVEVLNYLMLKGWILTGSISSFESTHPLPDNQTILFVANHQSMFDIPGIIWYLRKYTPLFISKKELSKGIPSISYNLRVAKAALIDRKDSKQAIAEIIRFAEYINTHEFSAAIFPEGTRSKNGILKPFQVGGLATLIKKCPNAKIVPIAIQNTGKFNPTGLFPLRCFTKMKWTTLEPIDATLLNPEEVTRQAENQIRAYLDNHSV
ncbi:MAG: lysophospholipid acyltransferase family protein [Leadbetterella sp.]